MARQKTITLSLSTFFGWLLLTLFTLANMSYTVFWLFFERPQCECLPAAISTHKAPMKAPIKSPKSATNQ